VVSDFQIAHALMERELDSIKEENRSMRADLQKVQQNYIAGAKAIVGLVIILNLLSPWLMQLLG
jgi:hypothetical protein